MEERQESELANSEVELPGREHECGTGGSQGELRFLEFHRRLEWTWVSAIRN